VRRGADCAHAGSAATGRKRVDCGRIALEERRAADRGAARAMFLRPSIVMRYGDVGIARKVTKVGSEKMMDAMRSL
jgi:hypothetical protein